MMKLQPDETELTGSWLAESGNVRGDSMCERINWLVTHHLQTLASTSLGGREFLFRDPDDSRYWELTYPQAQQHDGGPPKLRHLTLRDAVRKYEKRVVATGIWLYDGTVPHRVEIWATPVWFAGSRFDDDLNFGEFIETNPIPETPDGHLYRSRSGASPNFLSLAEAMEWADAQSWRPVMWDDSPIDLVETERT